MSDILPTGTQENFIRNILASGPGSVAVIDYDTLQVKYCNQQFETLTGLSEKNDGKAGFSFNALMDEAQQLRLRTQLKLVYDHPEARSKYGIYALKTTDRRLKSFYLYAAPVSDGQQGEQPLFHLLILPDLSKWPMPFISFDTRELFLEQFNNTNFGTFEWIIAADKIFWSERVYDIYEIDDRSTYLNRNILAQYTHPDDADEVEKLLEQLLANGSTKTLKMKIITAKNNIKAIDILIEVLRDEKGKPVKLLGSIRDITEQNKIEEDLKRNVSELNRSNKELEEFAYVASHDLQEPLRKISTFSDRLTEKYKDVLSGDGLMYLQRIIASAGSMRMLIDNLLDFSRLSKSTQPFAEVNLGFVLREVKTELDLVIEETSTTVKSDALPTIDAVHSQMKQLFTNILGNAIKFRKPGVAPVIGITSAPLEESEAIKLHLPLQVTYYKIQITDNGIGFESEYAEKIFQIFQRLHAKSEYSGSGIGLAICKKITENHGGLISAENIPGQGAQFSIILPAKQNKT